MGHSASQCWGSESMCGTKFGQAYYLRFGVIFARIYWICTVISNCSGFVLGFVLQISEMFLADTDAK